MKRSHRVLGVLLLGIGVSMAYGEEVGGASMNTSTVYSVSGDAVVRENGDRLSNRPLYCLHRPALVMAGDRPFVTFASQPDICGTFMAAVVREGRGCWLHHFSEVRMLYRPGRVEWELSDPSLPGLSVVMETVTMAETPGFVVRMEIKGARAGDKLLWAFGGARQTTPAGTAVNQVMDPCIYPAVMERDFTADDCAGNDVRVDGDGFVLRLPSTPSHVVAGRCTEASALFIADAALWGKPGELVQAASVPEKPLLCGTLDLKSEQTPILWAIEDFAGEGVPEEQRARLRDPQRAYDGGIARAGALAERVVADTPVDWLNVAASAVSSSIDGAYYPPVYVHGCMAWNIPFPGWRTFYGATAYGWHENVKAQCAYYIASQTTESDKRVMLADPKLGYGQQAKDSRFYGKGRIQKDGSFYNFQSQFFDQAIYAWRATGDPELEKVLLPALELQLEWESDCFDPDGDGLYESYINCWPTDSQWYHGGGTAEESAYAYTGHRAAADLARRAGDEARAKAHEAMAAKIRKAVIDQMWVKDRGYVGSYREQVGEKRLHTDAWLYSIFLPIDAGMLSWQEAAQALRYTEWGLERVKMPFGGERCWTSNWVPSKWSVREMFVGDNLHLALAYFQAGLPEAAWELLEGTTLEAMFNEKAPGAINAPNGGTDFSDCASMFGRVIVEGLFGYAPDYPNGEVRFRPGFPRTWDHASIRIPDCAVRFKRDEGIDRYEFSLGRAARMRLELPVYAATLTDVRVDGKSVQWEVLPGIGRSTIALTIGATERATVDLHWESALETAAPAAVQGNVGEMLRLACDGATIVAFQDPQEILSDAKLDQGAIAGVLNAKPGNHVIFARVDAAKLEQWRQFNIQILDPAGDAAKAAQTVAALPADATWHCVNLDEQWNGDVRAIYKQEYLSPRPNTCSVRIGSDGYSPWCFYYWKSKLPEIDLTKAPALLDAAGRLMTPQGAPFVWPSGEKNIAFTSWWDNWPRNVTVPVNKAGEAIWLLVCGSTNTMQTRIANGQIRFTYEDGAEDTLDLVPPENFWTLCPIDNTDYDYKRDAFCLPRTPPPTVQLGDNCRAMVLNRRLREGITLKSVTLETLSEEVIIGLMGVSVMNPNP